MNIINIGILAHVDAGKTTLTESLLYASGAISEPGSVEKGTTRTDTMLLERQRGITIQAAVTSFLWRRCKVNIVDTPGHMDFLAEVYRSLAVLDGAISVSYTHLDVYKRQELLRGKVLWTAGKSVRREQNASIQRQGQRHMVCVLLL